MSYGDKMIDKAKLLKMYSIVRIEEANNLKSKKRTDSQMISRITSIIKSVLEEGENEV